MQTLLKTDTNKVAIIGCGRVGMTAAYAILHHNFVHELMLFGRSKKKLLGEKLDLEHAMSFLHSAQVITADDYAELKGVDVAIVTAGAAQEPGETRLDLAKKNTAIIEEIIPQVVKYSPDAIIIMVTNPVDVLTYKAYQIAGLPKGRIFGTGTVLDTSRFRFHLSEFMNINPRSIHAYILGEHGDSSFPVISSATVGGQALMSMPKFSQEKALKAYERARDAAYEIIASKGSTYYAIGSVIAHITGAVLLNRRSVLPVSIPLHQYLGFNGVSLSVPCVVGRSGVEEILEIKLSWVERQALAKSVAQVQQYLQ